MTDITDTWDKKELIPYQKLIAENNVDMIMMGHLFNANIDDKYPVSVSKNWTQFVRENLGFDGVLISDDMQMKAITDYYTLQQQVDLFLDSSMDIILFGNNLSYNEDVAKEVCNLIYNKVKEDLDLQQRIDQSFQRILKLKKRID
jgi:beta-N-acetylhexosaminidase